MIIRDYLEKFQLILIIYEGTSFTDKQSERKLEKIAQENWIDGLSSFLVSRGDLSMFITLPNLSSNGPRVQTLPLQKFQIETCIGSCAQTMVFGAWVGMEMVKI